MLSPGLLRRRHCLPSITHPIQPWIGAERAGARGGRALPIAARPRLVYGAGQRPTLTWWFRPPGQRHGGQVVGGLPPPSCKGG
ncbi:hypothetical protein XACS582_12900001 [Xanthomonas citri pv. citri]|nr:hypothetical protein XAC902_1710002 [Xanthomonas citri pv. citri]CEE57529.1 hypothetical protein XACS584_1760001 [Xanthomonas citri pv. citri]CEH57745.1 hypothetical protein XACS582_12900001 [Xanthomonas citri pv. citri]CEI02596.1 hypothetical protein XACS581_3240001 [Xanthomonas citri pv. citri]